MAQDKSSLAAAGDSIGFEISEDRGFECIGPYDITVACIKEYFGAESEVSSNDIEEKAASKGIKRNTLLSAKKKLGITVGNCKTTDGTMYWTWILPKKEFNNLIS